MEGVDIVSSSDAWFQVVVDGTLNTAFTNFPTANTDIPNNETALLVNNTATTISGGQVVYQGVLAGAPGAANRDFATAVLLSFELPAEQPVTLVIGTFSGTSAVSAVFRVNEEW
ncbi:hypothetical protein AWH56_015860 [Anaerobacillus isosaccharinicus]|uniref:Uncharacterized protein n=1 Tax=Anaerobacillus isosaccharinicus TaxID=1532552 RepID=A0A1S2M8K0_9BACI|nr:hypothetical protein [Anaerobacillus isosaccharinicus]MBA5587623.1 hypothetical protein [Anaerobacillus isosaccharinicus]QOY34201.1 hypothetical protein AWH56_015860 [Anaerobacillus isosaccharinicus]